MKSTDGEKETSHWLSPELLLVGWAPDMGLEIEATVHSTQHYQFTFILKNNTFFDVLLHT